MFLVAVSILNEGVEKMDNWTEQTEDSCTVM